MDPDTLPFSLEWNSIADGLSRHAGLLWLLMFFLFAGLLILALGRIRALATHNRNLRRELASMTQAYERELLLNLNRRQETPPAKQALSGEARKRFDVPLTDRAPPGLFGRTKWEGG